MGGELHAGLYGSDAGAVHLVFDGRRRHQSTAPAPRPLHSRAALTDLVEIAPLTSDVFYTNSRYAKVGGLPPTELNQLELQFLLLNNFTLMIPPEEMQRYGDRLLAYWQGREEDAGVTPEAATELRRQERERERDRERQRERDGRRASATADAEMTGGEGKRPSVQRASSHQPEVDFKPAAAVPTSTTDLAGAASSSSSTAPTTPAKSSSSKLGRSASLPRRPPSSDTPAPGTPTRGASGGGGTSSARPVVSFAGAPASGLREGGVVGVGP